MKEDFKLLSKPQLELSENSQYPCFSLHKIKNKINSALPCYNFYFLTKNSKKFIFFLFFVFNFKNP